MSTFEGQKLKRLIEEKGLRTQWVADQLGVTNSTLNRWMNAKMAPRADKLLAICDLLEIDPKDLFKVAS